jgi:hypothetical protein
VADAAKAVASGPQMRGKHRFDPGAEREIGMSDNRGAGPDLAIAAARAHGGNAVDELGLANRPHLRRPARAQHRARLHINGRDDIVPAAGVGQELVEQIAPSGPIPQMVMRIDNRQLRLEDRLLVAIEPILPHGEVMSDLGCAGGRSGHGDLGAVRMARL